MIRDVTKEDFKQLYQWINDIEVRKNNHDPRPIAKEAYKKWLTEKIQNPDTMMFIIKQDENNVGEIRIERHKKEGIIVYSIDKEYRCKGIAKKVIDYTYRYYQENKEKFKEINTLSAFVKTGNTHSIKVFDRNNFERVYEDHKYIVFKKAL